MRNFKTVGIVIKRRNTGEADRILTVFTKKQGKISIKAVGVRRVQSRRSPHIELLNRSMLTLYQGRGMSVLTEAETLEDFSDIKSDLAKIGFAYHICELVDGLCPQHQENRKVYELLETALARLATENDIVSTIHEFEIDLLNTLGFFPRHRVTDSFNTTSFIESLLERRLKSRQILPKFQ